MQLDIAVIFKTPDVKHETYITMLPNGIQAQRNPFATLFTSTLQDFPSSPTQTTPAGASLLPACPFSAKFLSTAKNPRQFQHLGGLAQPHP
jgi:hypothetical protein